MALLKVIEWSDNSHNTLVYKIDTKKNVIARGSALTVREGQAAVFCDKGRMADVFLPGYYKLDTDSLPVLTALLSWKYGFETPFKSEVYFVSTNRFTKQRWGTANPIMLRDPDFGAVRVRGYGTYSFRVKDPYVFMTELSGSHSTYRTEDISDHIRSMLVMAISDALGESGISVVDMAANLMELSDAVKASLEKRFSELGLELSDFNFENVSLPAELEKAMDENARLGMFRRNMDVYTRMAQADALKDAAKNPGTAGSAMGAGLGLGMGMQMMNAVKEMSAANGGGNGVPLPQMRRGSPRGREILRALRRKNRRRRGGRRLQKMRHAAARGRKVLLRMRNARRNALSQMRRKAFGKRQILSRVRRKN